MNDNRYTAEDLRAAAALMHYALTIQPNPADADAALSADLDKWSRIGVGSDEEEELRESVVELVSGAADVSRWAVDLGADQLKPSNEHAITVQGNGRPIARILFAFEPDMPEDMRTALVEGLGNAMANAL